MKDTDEINKFFDKNVEDYEAKHYGESIRTFMTVRQQRVLAFVDMLQLKPGAQVLDAGCGPGYLLAELAARNFQVSGMDGAEGMLRSAEARVNARKPQYPASFKQGDIEHLPYEDSSFDLVCSTGVIEYLKEDRQVLTEMNRV
ncbi:MAG TPA: class I SAM-dependent methyltransferase, partial [Spongiibacteraceae bacterium]